MSAGHGGRLLFELGSKVSGFLTLCFSHASPIVAYAVYRGIALGTGTRRQVSSAECRKQASTKQPTANSWPQIPNPESLIPAC